MKALILAAGLGTRLAPITNDRPKAMVPVNGKPIIFKQIENLLDECITDITVVSGYEATYLEKEIHAVWPDIHLVESVNYADTNNMYSAYLGLSHMYPEGITSSFVMMNADVFFDAAVLRALVKDPAPNAVVVDMGRYLEESMKVTEKNGRLTAISKTICEQDALGSSIDVYKMSPEGGAAFLRRCTDYIEIKKERKLWSEVALNDAFADAVFVACPLNGRWFEIDNHEDLMAAEALFRT